MKDGVMELLLEGLCCSNCAMKIEKRVSDLKEVENANVNFATKVLFIELTESKNREIEEKEEQEEKEKHKNEDILIAVKKIVKEIEPDVIVKEKNAKSKAMRTLKTVSSQTGVHVHRESIHNMAHTNGEPHHDKSGHNDGGHDEGHDGCQDDCCHVDNAHEVGGETDRCCTDDCHDHSGHDDHKHAASHHSDSCQDDRCNTHRTEDACGGSGCGCCSGEKEGTSSFKKKVIKFGLSAFIFAVAMIFKLPVWAEFTLFLISYLLSGGDVLLRAGRNILRGDVFDENFLMSIATIGAFAIGEFPEGVGVMLFYQIGEMFQDMAVNRSRKSIADLMDIRPDYANLKIGEEIKVISPEQIQVGDIILVKPGEKIPLDGKVIEGTSMLDTSALTGESVPREVMEGDSVLGGFINKNGLLTVEVNREFGESTVSKILDLVQNASNKKSPTENFITKFARKYTPVVTIAALILAVIPPLILPGHNFSDWVYRALIFLVISCPCALVVSIPLGFFGGIGGASRHGVLIKGSNFLEALNYAEIIVFDKTGTLTKGTFKVSKVNPSWDRGEEELLKMAAYAESYSTHPIALSILKAYKEKIDNNEIGEYEEISGYGTRIKYKESLVLTGNAKLMERENIPYNKELVPGTVVHLAVDGVYAGNIIISDEIKEDAKETIRGLKALGLKKLVMLTGDSKVVGEKIGKDLGLDEVHAELLPDQKVEELESLENKKSPKGKMIFVGDGINDAPVLARADIGVAMGGLGSDAAIEAADVVLMTDEPSKLITAIKIAKKTHSIVWQNIVFALSIKAIFLLLGAGGMATMWEAVFADVGVALLAVLNAMRAMSVGPLK